MFKNSQIILAKDLPISSHIWFKTIAIQLTKKQKHGQSLRNRFQSDSMTSATASGP